MKEKEEEFGPKSKGVQYNIAVRKRKKVFKKLLAWIKEECHNNYEVIQALFNHNLQGFSGDLCCFKGLHLKSELKTEPQGLRNWD